MSYDPEQQLGELAALPLRFAAQALRHPRVVPAALLTRSGVGQFVLRSTRQLWASGTRLVLCATDLGCGQPTLFLICIGRLLPSTLDTSRKS